MARPAKNNVADAMRATGTANADAASLATKVSSLSSHLEPRAGQFAQAAGDTSQIPARNGLFGRLFYWLICLVTWSLVTVAFLRIFYHDGNHFLIWLNAFTCYVYLPAYACLAWAVWKRRWFLALTNVAVISFHVAMLAPDFTRDRRFDAVVNVASTDATASPTLRIFFANVRGLNNEYQAMLEEISAANPDVIVLAEFSWPWRMGCLHSPVLKAYPFGGGLENQQMGTVCVFSRIPLRNQNRNWIGSRALQTFDIPVGSETLRIIGLHAPRPQNRRDDEDYESFWSRTIPTIQNEKGPLVVVGDFNATQYSTVYQQLTADRLRSAHQDQGRGYATTWPNGQYWLPPLIRIDQALLSPEVECVSIREGEGPGSDHKPLIVEVKIRPT
jgi:endonuclease/exonuclease/phosphatase (EEP) superfamily protein YafD